MYKTFEAIKSSDLFQPVTGEDVAKRENDFIEANTKKLDMMYDADLALTKAVMGEVTELSSGDAVAGEGNGRIRFTDIINDKVLISINLGGVSFIRKVNVATVAEAIEAIRKILVDGKSFISLMTPKQENMSNVVTTGGTMFGRAYFRFLKNKAAK